MAQKVSKPHNHLSSVKQLLRHPNELVLFLCLVCILMVMHERVVTGARVNRVHLDLLNDLGTEVNWSEHAASGSSTDSNQNVFASLADFHFVRQRPALGRLFAAMQHVYHREDEIAVSELQALRASGILYGLGATLNEREERQRATAYLESAARLAPDSYPILQQLAVLYLSDKRYCNLLHIASRGVDLYDSAMYYYYLGRAYEGLGAWQAAAQAYQQALERFADYAPYERLYSRAVERAATDPGPGAVELCDQ